MEVGTEHRLATNAAQSPPLDVDMMSPMDTPELKAAASRETSTQPTVDNIAPENASTSGRAIQVIAQEAAKIEPAS